MASRSKQTPRTTAPGDPEDEGYPVKRRTLHRAFAVAVAIVAISPLFAADPNGCARGSVQNKSTRQIRSSRTLELSHH
jgi:hypothetical protein